MEIWHDGDTTGKKKLSAFLSEIVKVWFTSNAQMQFYQNKFIRNIQVVDMMKNDNPYISLDLSSDHWRDLQLRFTQNFDRKLVEIKYIGS